MVAAVFSPQDREIRDKIVSLIRTATGSESAVRLELQKKVEKDTIFAAMEKAMMDKKSIDTKEGALLLFLQICQQVGTPAEPFLVPSLDTVLECLGDKQKKVRDASEKAIEGFLNIMNPQAIRIVLPKLLAGLDNDKKWLTKVACVKLLVALTKTSPQQMRTCIPEVIPVLSECMWDTKPEVQDACKDALLAVCDLIGNKDIAEFIPAVISSIATPTEVPECIHKLGATTFVSTVDQATLSIMVPLLIRAQTERATPIKRKTCVIIDNMCKLVDDPKDAALFLPKLLPGLERIRDEVADPEVRDVATRAHKTLMKAGGGIDPTKALSVKKVDPKSVMGDLVKALVGVKMEGQLFHKSLEYVSALCAQMIDARIFDYEQWKLCFDSYLGSFLNADKFLPVCKQFMQTEEKRCRIEAGENQEEEDETGVDLCNCEFSLAYGGKILLNNTKLRLKKGKRYGLCGPNGAGKSTLMRAISNGQLDGFPSKDVLRTVYVEHDIDGETAELSVIDFITRDESFKGIAVAEIERVLSSVGFTSEMMASPITALSGGWKMKLALARAMLRNADILLLDEPTNHLDVLNVAWLENYLNNLKEVTCMVVSHDSGFLDNVCTDIVHYEGLKLKGYKGNLSEFVKKVPEARSYYELASSQGLVFKFPEPGFLEGIKSKDRAILKMHDVMFQYPNCDNRVLSGVTIQCSLSSRVAVIGANGAGKSTMIKLLTGELEPNYGTIWKHPNMRIAYVAQHAFHHIEAHIDKTPNEYIQWRFIGGEDREELEKASNKLTEEELATMAKVQVVDGVKRVVDKILGRRKLGKSYEYEVQWKNSTIDDNIWMPRKQLMDMGFEKMIVEIDRKVAAEQGSLQRPLTQKAIEKHLADVGLEAEFATHSQMRGLSGGQKVKVVIAAAMWNNPHILVLDEPTNYLDRESLGALAAAIKEFGGGVVMISHNQQFTSELCDQVWAVAEGKLTPSGHNWTDSNAGPKIDWKEENEMIDAFGNVVKVTRKKEMTSREKREKKKRNALRKKQGLPVSDDDDDDF